MPNYWSINKNMKDPILKFKTIIAEAESKREILSQEKLKVSFKDLEPVMSEKTIKYHYGKLAKGYVERYNSKEGDDEFNYGGAILHNIFFPQLSTPKNNNSPVGKSKDIIEKKWKSFEEFKNKFSEQAMTIQGSGWIYMDSKGNIKTIENHDYRKSMDIVLLIDWWEHAWALDYEHDKSKYLKNIWRLLNWEKINERLD